MTSHIDISTGKIYGCKEGSWAYYHEKGHLAFNSSESTSNLKLYQGYAQDFWMISVTLAVLNKYMLFLAIPLMLAYLGISVYEEYWCNNYAKLRFKFRGEHGRKES